MNGISAIIITQNEEKNLKDCMDYLSFAGEIVVLDNGSTDKTAEIGESQNGRVFKTEGDDFAEIRNEGKLRAKYDWLLYIDADERVTKELAEEIIKIPKEASYSAYYLVRKNYFFGRLWPKSEKMLRFIKKDALLRWEGKLHETAVVSGKVGCLQAELLHYTHNDLSGMVQKTNKWSEIEAGLRFDSKHPRMTWWRFFRIMISAFWRSYVMDGGFRAGTAGVVESLYQSYSMFITYAKLWEKQEFLKEKK